MRQLGLRRHLLDLLSVQWGLFGVALFVSILILWINLRFAARNIDVSEGSSFFNKAIRHPADASRTINIDVSSKLLVLAFDAGIVIFSLLFALNVSGQWDTYLRFGTADHSNCGPSLWYRPWVLCVSPPVL